MRDQLIAWGFLIWIAATIGIQVWAFQARMPRGLPLRGRWLRYTVLLSPGFLLFFLLALAVALASAR